MQTLNEQLTRTVVLPTVVAPATRRRSPWPFPAGGTRSKTDDISATAKTVISTTTKAFLHQASGYAA